MYSLGICVDQRYFLPALTTLTSVADTHGPRDVAAIAIRVLTTDFTNSAAATMAAVVHRLGFSSFDIRWRTPPAGQPLACDHISDATYLRFAFGRRFVDRSHLVYLDSDTLVLGDISPPFSSLRHGAIALVRDRLVGTVGSGQALPGVVRRWPEFKGRPYFNAGIFWCQTDTLAGLRTGIQEILRKSRQHIHFNDQDALNLWVLSTRGVVAVDERYNTFELDRFEEGAQLSTEEPLRARRPVVLHFIGPDKPWQRSCPSSEGSRQYRQYLRAAMRLTVRAGDLTADLPRRGPGRGDE